MDFIHFSWWGDWVHLTHTHSHNNWNSMQLRAVFSSVIYLFVPFFVAFDMCFSLVCCRLSPTNNLQFEMDTRLHFAWNALFVIDLMCSGQMRWWSFFIPRRVSEWVCVYSRWLMKNMPFCDQMFADTLAHAHCTHSLTFRAKMREEYFKCLNMARRKSYGKYLLTDHQSIALHAHTYRIASPRIEISIPPPHSGQNRLDKLCSRTCVNIRAFTKKDEMNRNRIKTNLYKWSVAEHRTQSIPLPGPCLSMSLCRL